MKKEKTDFPDLSWRRYLLPPVHKEGLKILAVVLIISILFGFISSWFWLLFGPFCLFSFYFFRNPERVIPTGKDLILAPADGIVCKIEEVNTPKAFKMKDKTLLRVSIFMSVFNVHVNRAPVSGKVTALNYHPGKFVSVAEKDSEDNERQEILLTTNKGIQLAFTQIAGLVARRIYCPLNVGDELKAGQVFGMIRFGSRLDVYLPKGVKPEVLVGQTMVAGETIIAKLK